MIPKSIAPKLIKFAQTSNAFININANNKDKGIVEATIKPPRQFPNKKMRTKMTINAPSKRFFVTVDVVSAINLLRSNKDSIITPSGKDFSICAILCFTFSITSFEFAPLSIITKPPTTSPSPSWVNAP